MELTNNQIILLENVFSDDISTMVIRVIKNLDRLSKNKLLKAIDYELNYTLYAWEILQQYYTPYDYNINFIDALELFVNDIWSILKIK